MVGLVRNDTDVGGELERESVGAAWSSLVAVTDNYQRLRRHVFPPFQALRLRLKVTATNGSPTARLYEMRCYAPHPVEATPARR